MPAINKKKSVIIRKLGEETILYNPDTQKIHILNETALFVWHLCDGSHSMQDISEAVIRYFQIDSKKIGTEGVLQDITSIMDNFITEGVVEGSI